MNRREVLSGLMLMGAPKVMSKETNVCRDGLDLSCIMNMVSRTVRLEMSPAQHASYRDLTTYANDESLACAVGQMSVVPVVMNATVPKDEVWFVAHDGTVMSKITNLAIPNGF